MSSFNDVYAGLNKYKQIIYFEITETNILDVLVKKNLISYGDYECITSLCDSERKCDYFIEVLSKQNKVTLSELCDIFQEECPKLAKELRSDLNQVSTINETYKMEKRNKKILHRSLLSESQLLQSPTYGPQRLKGYNAPNTKDNMLTEHNINRESPRSRRSVSQCSCNTTSRRSSVAMTPAPLNNTVEMYVEPVVEDGDRVGWETHRVRLNRVPGYGFGIAVSGGRDNPHFASGDPSIAVSDVLRGGPAEDKLQVNDRIVTVNGIPLENVEYARAVQVLRESGSAVTLVVRRRAMVQPPLHTVRATLTRPNKKEDFGIVLGCKIFIKELTVKARDQLNAAGQSLCEGDIVTRINNTACTDSMTLKEAKKLIESCKDRLNLVVTREIVREETVNNSQNNYQNNYSSLGPAQEPLSPSYSGQNLYVAAPSRGQNLNESRSNELRTSEPRQRSQGPSQQQQQQQQQGIQPQHVDQMEQPPRPPPPRNDDYYSRRQLYEEDPMSPRHKATNEARLISFQKDGSVGVRVSGGNVSGVFVSGVQAGSPAAIQGLRPQDKILKVNDMEMKGVTREEAVLFLLSLQDRIDLIVQHAPEEYHSVASGQCPGDSFHIRCHFHYSSPRDGEMAFSSGDVFHVMDTLHRGTVGAWQVARIGRNNQEVQKGIIPNKARAEELATAQFNANKKELSTDTKTNFFRRRRSTHRRTKSLGKEHWDEVILSDSISKFPAYERVVLREANFLRPVLIVGALADVARSNLMQQHESEFAEPQSDNTLEDNKAKSSGIIRLSNIRTVMERGKHALLDVAPSAVDRLNYAQLYPIVVYIKADGKSIVKQLRASLPKSAHKSSKKLLESAHQMERNWSHVFTHTLSVSEVNLHSWSEKLYDLIQRTQHQQIWVSETKRSEPLTDDFLFPMSATTENRLSYASSPESDAEVSPPSTGRLVKASSDPSVATTQDIIDRNDEIHHLNDAVPPPYTSGYDIKYGFSSSTTAVTNGQMMNGNGYNHSSLGSQHLSIPSNLDSSMQYPRSPLAHSPPLSPLYGTVPELPPRVGAGVSGNNGMTNGNSIGAAPRPAGGVPLPAPPPARHAHNLRHHNTAPRGSAQERLFGPNSGVNNSVAGHDDVYTARPHHTNVFDGAPTYDYTALPTNNTNSRLGPNAPDDLKVAPPTPGKMEQPGQQINQTQAHRNSNSHDGHNNSLDYRHSDAGYRSMENGFRGRSNTHHARGPSLPVMPTNNDHVKYSSTGGGRPPAPQENASGAGYKPIPPPKPKHYRPPDNYNNGNVEPPPPPNSDVPSGRPASYYPPAVNNGGWNQAHYQQQSNYSMQPLNSYNTTAQSPPYNGPPQHRAINLPHNPHLIDLAGSREQRGSAFELYRKPQHMHNMSGSDANASLENEANITPKTKKKLSKKPSFIKNAVLDLFRSKSKNTHKVSRQKSLSDKQTPDKYGTNKQPMLRREKSDISGMNVHLHNTQIRNQMLARSNSSCEKSSLKPILKRQSSFCDGRSGVTCTVRDYDAKPIVKSLRRQSSMTEIETEPKIAPMLRRQNSLIDYNRRGAYDHSFNMITKIDPVYQRQHTLKHEPFHPTQPLPPEPIYQTKDHVVYDPIPKPKRTYAHNCSQSSDNPYSITPDQSFENPYGSRIMPAESPYGSRCEYVAENPYGETTYSTKEQMLKQRMCSESPYSTKEEMLRQRFSESPYASKHEMLKSRMENSTGREQIYGQRTYEPPNSWNESIYGTKPDTRRLQTPTPSGHFGRTSPMGKCMSEPPYTTKAEIMARVHSEPPYSTRAEVKSSCSESPYSTRTEVVVEKRPASVECAYVSRQEILNQKLANREAIYGTTKLEDKLEIIKQRNQAKKELIYQTRKEVADGERIREPIYVSKRELKESVIYEAHNEGKEHSMIPEECSGRSSPYKLSDANHLSRRDPNLNKNEGSPIKDTFQEIDFAALRLTESKTDYEKEQSLELEAKVLKGEPIYTPRLHSKDNVSDAVKSANDNIPYESTTSIDTNFTSVSSMNFDVRAHSTPYTSQDLDNQTNEPKPNRTVTFCDIAEKSVETSDNGTTEVTHDETTIVNNDNTILQSAVDEVTVNTSNTTSVQPDGPHTTWGIFDSDGGVLEDRQWGVSLIIPPKAIAPGIKQKIYFTVTDPRHSQNVGGPPMDMDNGEAMLSPLVMCGPQGLVFLRPVTLRLPHCANAVPSLGLTIKATDTEAHLTTDWDNIHLPATTTLNTVAVKVDHF